MKGLFVTVRSVFNKKKHEYENLGMGYIGAYSIIIPKTDLNNWINKGWIESPKFRNYHYAPEPHETVILNKPKTIAEIDVSRLIGCTIENYTCLGTYGIGSPGFTGFLIKSSVSEFNDQYIVFAVIDAEAYVFVDGRPISGNHDFNPWIPLETDEDFDNWNKNYNEFINQIEGLKIQQVKVSDYLCSITLQGLDRTHSIEFVQNSSNVSPFRSGKLREDSFRQGTIGDYIVFQDVRATLHQ
ncbi:MAG: hypothetical protein BWY74_02943 [Firmicutes bacterium ADurb.Bin419]|nr:MAG: hypothetical protein BWY74_02943 [Firmicutes bacterium ADurb.Bin419]